MSDCYTPDLFHNAAGQTVVDHAPASAVLSACGLYRYELWRRWNDKPFVLIIGLNPSTADHTEDDRTTKRCIRFARAWGFGALCLANLFAFRATEPKDMIQAADPVGPENDRTLFDLAGRAGMILAAWGEDGAHNDRPTKLLEVLPPRLTLHHLILNQDGSPRHPLYVAKRKKPLPWLSTLGRVTP